MVRGGGFMNRNNKNLIQSPSRLRGAKYYWACKYHKRPYLVNLEVTKRCNAKCDFCAYWQDPVKDELDDYAPVIKKLRPVVVSITGGEPLIRKDLCGIIRGARPYCHYMVMITNGALLNEDVAENLSDAGINQLAISLDYLSEQHDEVRKLKGLFDKISTLVPKLASKGYKIVLNTVIMEANLDHIIPLAHQAKSWGAGISYSTYCSLKKSDDDLMIRDEKIRKMEDIVSQLIVLKRRLGNIRNSDFYLNGISAYFRTGGRGSCRAGKNWVQVTPNGSIKPCSELPKMCGYEEYDRKNVPQIDCTQCWYTCRGEAEAPHLAPNRLIELFRA